MHQKSPQSNHLVYMKTSPPLKKIMFPLHNVKNQLLKASHYDIKCKNLFVKLWQL